jgi:hypothetical protein
LECERLVFSAHAVQRMFQRGIARDEVKSVIAGGEIIAEYPDDSPYASRLMLRFVERRPIHVVVALDTDNERCIVITAYIPRLDQWHPDFRTRRTK